MDNINNIFLRDNVIKICDIRPCGCNIPLSTVHVSGYKNILARLTISDIRKLLASGIRVCEYTKRDEKNNLDGLQVINTNNFNRVVSMEHVRLLKSINRGYIDIANSIFAGTVTPAPENKKEDKNEDGNISEISYHYKDIMSIISNQYIKQTAPQFCNEISNVILKNNFILVSESKIKEITNRYPEETIITAIFPSNDSLTIDTPKAFSKYLQGIITELISQYSEITDTIEGENEEVSDVTLQSENNDIDSNFLLQYKQYLNQLNEYIKDYITDVDLKTFCSFLDHLTANLKIQLHGEPLKELQIMGMLESRLLDFKNIIIIGFNDENLPGINTSSTSMIPYILRKAYGIPTFEQHNAIYAYNFFRTLYRADKVSCIYNSQELISQYYYIFKFAISQIYNDFKMNHYSEKADVVTNIDNNITTDNTDSEEKDLLRIEKSGKILGILNKYQSDGTDKKTLSPSALKKYINCFLFYTLKNSHQILL